MSDHDPGSPDRGHQDLGGPDPSGRDLAGPDVGALLGGAGGGPGGGLGDLFAQAQAAMEATQAAADAEVEGSAGGGVVKVRATGGGEVLDVTIDPVVVDPSDVETLEDLVVAALRDVNAKVAELQADAMGNLDPTAMLGGLSGMFGAGPELDGPELEGPDPDDPKSLDTE